MATAGNALISVYDKTGIGEFASGLKELGWDIYASGGTAKAIVEAGTPVTDVAELVGGKAILGHRVVTLSREIGAALLARPEDEQDMAELKEAGIPLIDLVCVDMYPLEAEIARPGSTDASILEQTDIGGPTMLREAAKGRRIVLSRGDQRQAVLEWLKAGKPDEAAYRKKLAAVAEREVAHYVLQSAIHLGGGDTAGFVGGLQAVPKYGENAWQRHAGLYAEAGSRDPLALDQFALRQGTELSFNNYADVDRLLQTVTHVAAAFDRAGDVPAIALGVKHGNTCGAAVAATPEEAIKRMLEGDPRAIFGGSVLCNFALTKERAELLMSHGMEKGKRLLDVVVAADVDDETLQILNRKNGKLRLLTNGALDSLDEVSLDTSRRFRYVRGGVLAQDNYGFVLDLKAGGLERSETKATAQQERDMLLGWAIGSTSNSNTIALVKDGMLIGNGVGQQDRVSAAELALKRARDAGHDIKGATAYSDSFFPFPDGPEALADAGVAAIFATRGSVKDAVVADAMNAKKVAFYTMPDTDARGFYAH